MAYSPEVIKRARDRLAQAKADRESENNQHLLEAYRQLPRLREIDRKLQQTMLAVAQSTFTPGCDVEAALQKAKEANLSLQRERAQLIALHFEQQKRKKANFMVSVTLIIGHLGAWALSGYLSGMLNWRASFLVPGVLVLPVLLAVWWMFRTAEINRGSQDTVQKKTDPQMPLSGMMRVFVRSGFLVVLLASIVHGFVRDGISNWAPSILGGLSEDALSATSFSLIIPVVNAFGMVISYVLQERANVRNRKLMALLLMLSACFCVLLMGGRGMLLSALLMGLGCACYSGIAPIINTLIPLEYEPEKLIGLTAGVIDSSIYLGSALAGVCGGWITEKLGLNALFAGWTVAALAGGAAMLIADRMMVKYRKGNQ